MKANKGFRYSIVIPCFNEENYIEKSINSLKNQDFSGDFEIIVVDNNSTDNTANVAAKLGARVIKEANPGVCFAREKGTNEANGEIIISTDADTVFKKNWLSKIDQNFTKNNDLIAVCGPCRYMDGPWWGKVYTHFLFGYDYVYSKIAGHPFYVTATNIAFKKEHFEGYDLSTMQGGDELYLLHSLRKHGKIKFLISNTTLTSGRRLTKGLFYNLFVTFFYYYLGAYYLNKIFKKQIIGSAPAFRDTVRGNRISLSFPVILLVVLILASTSYRPVRHFISDNITDTRNHILSMFKAIK